MTPLTRTCRSQKRGLLSTSAKKKDRYGELLGGGSRQMGGGLMRGEGTKELALKQQRDRGTTRISSSSGKKFCLGDV